MEEVGCCSRVDINAVAFSISYFRNSALEIQLGHKNLEIIIPLLISRLTVLDRYYQGSNFSVSNKRLISPIDVVVISTSPLLPFLC